ncbi:MAG: oligopeptide/dipeptide ABC transporter ATP-binding protein, partial [Candidatus Rokuibacteriota bacterium]
AMAVVLITHDLGVVADYADRIVVMYAGRVIETLPTATLFTASAHPYSQALLASMPSTTGTTADLHTIRGAPPDPRHIGPGCAFAPRCDRATRECHETLPPTVTVEPRHTSACLHALDPVAHA